MVADAPAATTSRARELWVAATLLVTVGPVVCLAVAAPAGGAATGTGLGLLLFVGSSVHVASTGWFYSVAEVRSHMRAHPMRYGAVPLVLVGGSSALAAAVDARTLTWILLGFFAWQFHHFQKQNLGIAALAARSHHARGLDRAERAALIGAGAGGILALVAHPLLLQLVGVPSLGPLFALGVAVFGCSVATGLAALIRRAPADRPAAFVAAYGTALLFFLPVFLFASPYAAVAGLTIAHGLQYLLLMALVAARPSASRTTTANVVILVNVALIAGLVLNRFSHLHDSVLAGRVLFGIYLGLTMTHFVVDAGLWRLRDEFPRTFLAGRLPFLLAPHRPQGVR